MSAMEYNNTRGLVFKPEIFSIVFFFALMFDLYALMAAGMRANPLAPSGKWFTLGRPDRLGYHTRSRIDGHCLRSQGRVIFSGLWNEISCRSCLNISIHKYLAPFYIKPMWTWAQLPRSPVLSLGLGGSFALKIRKWKEGRKRRRRCGLYDRPQSESVLYKEEALCRHFPTLYMLCILECMVVWGDRRTRKEQCRNMLKRTTVAC